MKLWAGHKVECEIFYGLIIRYLYVNISIYAT